MKLPDHTKIQSLQAKILAAIRKVDTSREALATIETDIAKFRSEREKLGHPQYSDKVAIARIGVLEQQIQYAEATLVRSAGSRDEAISELRELALESGHLAQSILKGIVGRRLETITSVILPFTSGKHSAQLLAEQTECYQVAVSEMNKLDGYGLARNPNGHPGAVVKYMRRINAILGESLKDNPDLLQFIPDYRPAN